ncbi:ABC transporter ATP-binding protein [Sporolituus thermophilus]|uniref:ATP-binding cassette, subfamily B n=1 Tax=Sporolituus thermophilus DSM 23256 TaxID=1123285 RepID=A0A1G7LE66_9FIRM|nr:ABC transporter ATP-binding protein [Sporolituus thermophilus]SDF47817.1 ATP-binding cassette, subfamily B [Sporolituus thermophilus DSM 23256]
MGIIFLMVADILQLYIPRLIGNAIDHLATTDNALNRDLILLGVVTAAIALVRYLYREGIMGSARLLEFYLREQLYQHALRLPMDYYDRHGPAQIMALTTNDISAVRVAVGLGSMLFVDAVIMGLVSLLVMGSQIHWGLTVLAVLPLPVILVLATWMGDTVHRRFRAVQEQFAALTAFSQEIFSGLQVIKGFAAEQRAAAKFKAESEKAMASNMAMAKLQAAYIPLTHLAPLVSYAIALYVGGLLLIEGTITVGDFTAFIGYLGLIIWPVMGLGYLINIIQRGTASLTRLANILTERTDECYAEASIPDLRNSAIEIVNLSFRYRLSEKPALQKFSLTVPPGKTVGIVGPTGAGKSTLLKLLLRLYEPPVGTIYIGGREIHEIDCFGLRQAFGYVPQENILFARTVGDNIGFDKAYSRTEIEDAARKAIVKEAIDKKIFGFETLLAERGRVLSGGQQQRISIARALIKKPPVLLLDDIFSALDYQTQAELLANLRETIQGCTTILVSQRVKVVKDADLIVVIDKGCIVEQGTHHELVARNGLYRRLYEQQTDFGDME